MAAGIGMRNLGYGTVEIAGIPQGSVVEGAYLFWDVLAETNDTAFARGSFDATPITGSEIGEGASPCWPQPPEDAGYSNFSYVSNVTSLVAGDGAYDLTGFDSGATNGEDPWIVGSPFPELEGASLVVVYYNRKSPETTIQLYGGATEFGGSAPLSQTINGFNASSSPSASTTYIVADGQTEGDGGASFDGSNVVGNFEGSDPQAVPSYSDGNLWDTSTADVSSLVRSGATRATLVVGQAGGDDCLVWVGQVFAVSSGAATGGPSAPGSVKVVPGAGFATVSWTESAKGVGSFLIEVSDGQSELVSGGQTRAANFPDLPVNTSLVFRVVALSTNGSPGPTSDPSTSIQMLPPDSIQFNCGVALAALAPQFCSQDADITISKQQNAELYSLDQDTANYLLRNTPCSEIGYSDLPTSAQDELKALQDINATSVFAFARSSMEAYYSTEHVAQALEDLGDSIDECVETIGDPAGDLYLIGSLGVAAVLKSIPEYSYSFSTGSQIASPGTLSPGSSVQETITVGSPTGTYLLFAFQGSCLFSPVLEVSLFIGSQLTGDTNPCTDNGVAVADAPVAITFSSDASPAATASIDGSTLPNSFTGEPVLQFTNGNGQITVSYTSSTGSTACPLLPSYTQCPLLTPTAVPIEPPPAGCGEGTISSTCDELVFSSPSDDLDVEPPSGSWIGTSYQYIPVADLPEFSNAPASWTGSSGANPTVVANNVSVSGQGGFGTIIVGQYGKPPRGTEVLPTGVTYFFLSIESDPFSTVAFRMCTMASRPLLYVWDSAAPSRSRSWSLLLGRLSGRRKCGAIDVSGVPELQIANLGSAVLALARSTPTRAVIRHLPSHWSGKRLRVNVEVTNLVGGHQLPSPTGQVTITVGRSSCHAHLSVRSGSAFGSCVVVIRSTGTQAARAVYRGDASHNTSDSPVLRIHL